MTLSFCTVIEVGFSSEPPVVSEGTSATVCIAVLSGTLALERNAEVMLETSDLDARGKANFSILNTTKNN